MDTNCGESNRGQEERQIKTLVVEYITRLLTSACLSSGALCLRSSGFNFYSIVVNV
jgi:hypothetical protein